MPIEQVPLQQLLKDPVYKAWVKKVPGNDKRIVHSKVWCVRYRQDKKWGKWECRRFHTYAGAYKWAAKNLRHVQDMAIGCSHREFKPPIVKVGTKEVRVKKTDPRGEVTYTTQKVPVRKYLTQLPDRLPAGHNWCGYCRRPTVFGFFKRHHALSICVPYKKRCRICGVRLSFLGKWSQ